MPQNSSASCSGARPVQGTLQWVELRHHQLQAPLWGDTSSADGDGFNTNDTVMTVSPPDAGHSRYQVGWHSSLSFWA